jgi:prepilin-type N-terminal cleavage/methylation domain-containing protein
MNIKLSRKAAFTLVEIMIVVAIIGLLAGIAIPNFIKARETARKNTCINNLRLIDAAIQQWALENNKNGSDPVVLDSLTVYLNRGGTGQVNGTGAGAVKCPSGGTYSATSVDTKPACSKTDLGHALN